ncbi:unnamed protein product [Clonostachys rosea f. rosea IK726]|uniref:Transcription factor domain-containing protein n=2 Tax=Bionectria ochroleuca TaxID=29856 RepID=A0A0B7JNI7_BIOOC|nr:unnamed protein product [Clonostachys rosea f. rosea IK726]
MSPDDDSTIAEVELDAWLHKMCGYRLPLRLSHTSPFTARGEMVPHERARSDCMEGRHQQIRSIRGITDTNAIQVTRTPPLLYEGMYDIHIWDRVKHLLLVLGAETLLNNAASPATPNRTLLLETGQTQGHPEEDCIALTMAEPTYFRSTLMLAGLHYMWKVGAFQEFEKSVLFHKQQLIQLVNSWLLGDVSLITSKQLKLIAILSIAESCVGNYPVAEAHLSGLLSLIEMRQESMCSSNISPESPEQEEALERLILVAHHFASAVKSRLTHTLAGDINYASIWQRSFTGMSENLVALRQIPFYLQENRPLMTHPIMAVKVIDALRGLTEAVRKRRVNDGAPHVVHDPSYANETTICDSQDPASCTGCKSLSCLLFAFTEAHVSSTLPTANQVLEGTLLASWRALAASVALYLNNVLLLWNSGQPIDRRLFLRILRTLVHYAPELKNNWNTQSRRASELPFWMLYTASFALTTHPQEGSEQQFEEIRSWLRNKIRRWARTYQVLEWTNARASLSNIIWPQPRGDLQEEIARQIWNAILM